MTFLPIALNAICQGLAAYELAMGTALRSLSGNSTAHSSTCIPPMEPPMTESHCWMPRWLVSFSWARTISRIVTAGKRDP